MAAVETAPGFIRPDGKEKVTGTGRYTADLNLTGMAHAKFRYADHSHARILRHRHVEGERAARRRRDRHAGSDLPDVRFGSFVQDRYLFAKDVVRFEGEIVAGVAALTPEIAAEAARLIEIEYEPLPVDRRLRGGDGARRAADPSRPRVLRQGRQHRRERQHDGLPHHRRRATPTPRWRPPTWSSRAATSPTRRRACRSSRARSSRSGRATRSPSGRRRRCRTRRAPASRRRCDPRGGRARRSCRCSAAASARSAICTSRARSRRSRARPSARSSSCSPARRSSARSPSAARASSMEFETGAMRDGRIVARKARPRARQGRVLRRGRVPRADGGDARLRPVHHRRHPRRVAI